MQLQLVKKIPEFIFIGEVHKEQIVQKKKKKKQEKKLMHKKITQGQI